MSNLTYEQVHKAIYDTSIFSYDYNGNAFEIQCLDKIMIVTFDPNIGFWVLEPKIT